MKTDISVLVCFFLGKDVGLELRWWLSFAFAYNLMKSFLMALCSSSHSRCSLFVYSAVGQLEDGRPCCWLQWDSLSPWFHKGNVNLPGETTTYLHGSSSGLNNTRLMGLIACIAVMQQCKHKAVGAYLHVASVLCTTCLPYTAKSSAGVFDLS